MTLLEMKLKVLRLIEEVNPDSELLTDDPDIANKLNDVINQILYELCRLKKIPKYIELTVSNGEIVDMADLEKKCGYEIYQISTVRGVDYETRANGTVLKFKGDGTVDIDVFVYPERITDKTKDKAYEFELSPDALEVMPYGVAGDLLKSDVSTEYGRIYSDRYNELLERLDSRYQLNSIYVEGGVLI